MAELSPKHVLVALAVALTLLLIFDPRVLPSARSFGPNVVTTPVGDAHGLSASAGLAARYAAHAETRWRANTPGGGGSGGGKARVFRREPKAQSQPILEAEYDVVMVGAGLSGGVLAERLARLTGARVLLIDKRDHIGGNCYDYIDPDAGILVNRYGAHLFHTELSHVYAYITSLHPWERYDHQVLARVDGRLVPVPVNINTVNALLNLTIKSEAEMDAWLSRVQVQPAHGGPPANSKEMALSRVGRALYAKVFEPYTRKQWAKDPAELAASVTARIPVRNNFDNRYFADRFQALPSRGYTAFFDSLLAHPNITVLLDTDFFEVRKHVERPGRKVFYTGPIDTYFAGRGLGALEYRSIRFVRELYRDHGYAQPVSVVNYPQDETQCGFADCGFTRIVEYKHYYNQQSPHTVTFREYSSDVGDPYYPVPNARNVALYEQFKKLAAAEKDVYFVGRLANYKYFNMDQAIDNALAIFEQTACEVRPGSAACAAVGRGEHPSLWATKPVAGGGTGAAGAAPAASAGAGGLVGAGGGADKALDVAWKSPSDD